MHRRTTILTTTAVLALLAGCGGAPAAVTGGAAATASKAAATASKAPAEATLADCLVGGWALDPSSFDEMVKSLLSSSGATAPQISYTGTSTTTFAKDGTYNTDDNLTVVVKATAAGQAMETSSTSTGEQKGTWKLDGATLTAAVTENGFKSTNSVTVDGEVKDVPASDGSESAVDGALPETPMAARCDATTLTLTLDIAAVASAAGETPPAGTPAQIVVAYKRA